MVQVDKGMHCRLHKAWSTQVIGHVTCCCGVVTHAVLLQLDCGVVLNSAVCCHCFMYSNGAFLYNFGAVQSFCKHSMLYDTSIALLPTV